MRPFEGELFQNQSQNGRVRRSKYPADIAGVLRIPERGEGEGAAAVSIATGIKGPPSRRREHFDRMEALQVGGAAELTGNGRRGQTEVPQSHLTHTESGGSFSGRKAGLEAARRLNRDHGH